MTLRSPHPFLKIEIARIVQKKFGRILMPEGYNWQIYVGLYIKISGHFGSNYEIRLLYHKFCTFLLSKPIAYNNWMCFVYHCYWSVCMTCREYQSIFQYWDQNSYYQWWVSARTQDYLILLADPCRLRILSCRTQKPINKKDISWRARLPSFNPVRAGRCTKDRTSLDLHLAMIPRHHYP